MAKSKIKIPFPVVLPFDGEPFREIWEKWLKYRSERKLPVYKPTGLEMVFEMIKRESNNDEATAVAMIKHSMEQYYQGIFKLKNNGQGLINVGTPEKRSASEDRINAIRNWAGSEPIS